jgi:hypothetical protein
MTAALRRDFGKIIGEDKNLGEIAYGKLRSFLVTNTTLNGREEITSCMDQRLIALHLSMKGLLTKAIVQNLV